MTFDSPAGGGPRGPRIAVADPSRRRGRTFLITLAVLGALLVVFAIFTSFYTDLLWYDSVDAGNVFTTQLVTKIGLLVVFGLGMALIVGFNMWLAYRLRPVFRPMSPEQAGLDRYRTVLNPFRRFLLIGVSLFLGLLTGVSATAEWQSWLEFRNGTEFGITDPQFGLDVSFYVFTLPFLRFVIGFLFAALVLSFIVSIVTHYVYGGIRLQPADDRFSRAAQAHLGVLVGLFVLLKAISYWLDRYELSLSTDDFVPGITYKDENALLPGLTILVFVSLICAVLFFVSAFRQGFTLAITSLVLLVGSAILVGSIYPAFVQGVQVKPNEPVREAPYITRNINATRAAYGVDKVVVKDYPAQDSTTQAAVDASKGTIDNVRLLDPAIVSPTYRALQTNRNFYRFTDSLDIDRYSIDGQLRGAVVSVRELSLSGIPDSQRNWPNDHAVYTHGYGFVAAYDNTSVQGGKPNFFESEVPQQGKLDIAQPRIYFGEFSPPWSIVGAPEGSAKREFDFPSADGQTNYTYTGKGGIPIGSAFNKVLFSAKYWDKDLLLSDFVNQDSKILEVRDPRQRVEKVAPWLEIDGDPYPVVVGGKIVWMVDGYTTTAEYPNSTPLSFSDATNDSVVARTGASAVAPRDEINYIRNSVKATVDAYDGTVTLYQWDTTDPILQTWMKAFPGTVQPRSAIPADVLSHVRYPEDMFKIQRQIYSKYHVSDPNVFFNGQDFWNVPDDPTRSAAPAQPPYYLQVQMPGRTAPVFSLTTTFAPQKRQTLAAFMAASSDLSADYGQITVLQLPPTTTIPGPKLIQNTFESDPVVSSQLTLLRRGGSDVQMGNLLSLPAAGGVLYVEPVYIRSSQADGYPLLQKVLVGFGSKVAMENTLTQALAVVLGTTPPSSGDGGTGSGTGSTDSAEKRLAQAIADAQTAYDDGQAALAKGDFAAYGEAQKRLETALQDAAAAQQDLGLPTSTTSPSPSASPSDPAGLGTST